MKFVARVYPERNEVVVVKENGEVRSVNLDLWRKYLNKCHTNGAVYLCNKAAMVSKGNLFVGVVTDSQPLPEPVMKELGIPEFLLEDLVSMMYLRDAMFDLSCVGCESVTTVPAAYVAPQRTSELSA